MPIALLALVVLTMCSLPAQAPSVVAGPIVPDTGVGPSAAQHHSETRIIKRIKALEKQVEELQKQMKQ